MRERTERDEVIDFAKSYQGYEWNISSIDAYRYKDTGEWFYCAHMGKRNWDGIGDRRILLVITHENNTFSGRMAELSKWPDAWHYKR